MSLYIRLRSLKLFSSEKLSGIDPERKLSERSKFVRGLILLNSLGIEPVSWFLKRKSDCKLVRFENSFGIDPDRFAPAISR
jgi:hypothetical protein